MENKEFWGHLRKLASHFYKSEIYGRPSVMVGAGFSRNADSVDSTTPEMPNWVQLIEPFFKALEGEQAQYKNENALDVFQQYKDQFGRDRLEKLLNQTIPWQSYKPGALHSLLLRVNWADVFTTNYDQLIEESVDPLNQDQQPYQLVETKEDLSGSIRARIVKLHGSFRAQRPFILTREDYANYPTSHALFVNTVRQALIEGPLVLIGFSGDDPNFIEWREWILDRLENYSQQVYLCGLLNLSSVEEKSLRQRNIIPLDLVHLFDGIEGVRPAHSGALERFFEYLITNQQPFINQWPVTGDDSSYYSLDELFSDDTVLLPIKPNLMQGEDIDQAKAVKQWLAYWDTQEKAFPGWFMVPRSNRQKLMDDLRNEQLWFFGSFLKKQGLSFLSLAVLARYGWLFLRLGDVIVDAQFAELMDQCLELVAKGIEDDRKELRTQNKLLVRIISFLLWQTRIEHNVKRFEEIVPAFDKLELSEDDREFLSRETVILYLNDQQIQKAKAAWAKWPQRLTASFLQLAKAGLGCELGETATADQILKQVVQLMSAQPASQKVSRNPHLYGWALLFEHQFEIIKDPFWGLRADQYYFDWNDFVGRLQRQKSQLDPDWFESKKTRVPVEYIKAVVPDPVWTQEEARKAAEATQSFHGVKSENKDQILSQLQEVLPEQKFERALSASIHGLNQHSERMKAPDRWEANPYKEISFVEEHLEKGFPRLKKGQVENREFDLFDVRESKQLFSGYFSSRGLSLSEASWAQQWVHLHTTIGIPLTRIGLNVEAAKIALRELEDINESFKVGFVIMLRTSSEKLVQDYLTLERVQSLSDDEVEWADTITSRALEHRWNAALETSSNPLTLPQTHQLNQAIEILSRLSMRFSEARLHELLKEALTWTTDKHLRALDLGKAYRNLLSRTMSSLSQEGLFLFVPSLLNFRILTKKESELPWGHFFPDPIDFLSGIPTAKIKNAPKETWEEVINDLLNKALWDDEQIRKTAIGRLSMLEQMDLLTSEQGDKLAYAVWAKLNPETQWPLHTRLYQWSVVLYAEKIGPSVQTKLRQNLIRPFKERQGTDLWNQRPSILTELYFATKLPWSNGGLVEKWTSAEIHEVFKWAHWLYEKYSTKDQTPFDRAVTLVEETFSFLSLVIPAQEIKLSGQMQKDLAALWKKLEKDLKNRLIPAMVWTEQLDPQEAYNMLSESMMSADPDSELNAIRTQINWWKVESPFKARTIELPGLSVLIQSIFQLGPRNLESALDHLVDLIEINPNCFSVLEQDQLAFQLAWLERRTRIENSSQLLDFETDPEASGIPIEYVMDLRGRAFQIVSSLSSVESNLEKQKFANLKDLGQQERLAPIRNWFFSLT